MAGMQFFPLVSLRVHPVIGSRGTRAWLAQLAQARSGGGTARDTIEGQFDTIRIPSAIGTGKGGKGAGGHARGCLSERFWWGDAAAAHYAGTNIRPRERRTKREVPAGLRPAEL